MRIILADDHTLVRDSLKQYLLLLDETVEVIEASSLDEVLRHEGVRADLILLDLQMPGMIGPTSVAEVRKRFPDAPIAVVSGFTDPTIIRASLDNGADGYIPKTARGKSLVTALKLVIAGETYVPPSLLEDGPPNPHVFPCAISTRTIPESSNPQTCGFEKLTERETSVLKLLINGKANKEIAPDLDLQEVTVKVHLRNVYRKLNANNRTDAVRMAMTQGWQASAG